MLLALVFLVAAFIGFFDFIQPAYGNIGNLRGEASAEQQLLTTLTATVQQAQALLSSYGSQSSSTAGIGMVLPAGTDVAGALAQVNGIATADNLTITSIAVSTPVLQTQPATSVSSTLATAKPAGEFSLKIAATGSYESFKSFLSDIETNIRLFDVESVSLQPVAAAAASGKRSVSVDYFTYNIVAQTYYQTP